MAAVDGFVPMHISQQSRHPSPQLQQQQLATWHLFASRYNGPPVDGLGKLQDFGSNDDDNNENRSKEQKAEFRDLLDRVLTASKAEHIPSLLTKHTELLLRMPGMVATEVIQELLEESNDQGGESEVERVAEAIDMVLSFTEDFVNQSKSLDDDNKQLLGKIIRTMTDTDGSEREREENLDELIAREKEHFTRGFLRHLDGECERIASAPSLNKESMRLQEILFVIKTRILEELGEDLGEGALVLGQLIAYEDKKERLAVLEAGLQVRGIGFAQELLGLTEEALEGFQAVPNGVDPTLVSRVEEIDERVKSFVEENSTFQ